MKNTAPDLTGDLLLKEFELRRHKNRQYSIRGFARDLEIDSSLLSKIINGKRIIKDKMAASLRPKFKQNSEVKTFKNKNLKEIDVDHFKMISVWYRNAILELLFLKDFTPNTKWISDKLVIPESVVQESVEQLFRLGYLVDGPKGKWFSFSLKTVPLSKEIFTTPALISLQKQILSKAIKALENTPIDQRDQSLMIVCVDLSKLPEAKERVKKFRRELMKFIK
ncbi:MAG: TIGR02147 family protein [Pseudobdellovibrio sp.]